ncbi:MAG: hypothetical protein AABZ47_09520 [Planctomycetota bacterium]
MTNVVRHQPNGWIAFLCVAAMAFTAPAAVELEWRPPAQGTSIGEVVELGLFASSDSQPNENFSALSVILSWDPLRLELVGFNREGEGYSWLKAFFPNDNQLDGLNADCGDIVFCNPYSSHPYNDGNAFFEAWGMFAPAIVPQATSSGLLITRFQFRALRAGLARVQFLPMYGDFTRTRVLHGSVPGTEITGDLGPPADITIAACSILPDASAIGGRYLSVAPTETFSPVAIRISGRSDQPAVACVSKYVQSDGSLGDSPVFLSSISWGTMHITGEEIIPDTVYSVQIDCGTEGEPALSPSADVRTWVWGDVNNTGQADTDDILLVIDASQGVLSGVTLEGVDVAGCLPNGEIDTDDILSVLDAAQGVPYQCAAQCAETGFRPADIPLFVSCLRGPSIIPPQSCVGFDFRIDGDVDLSDWADFQNLYIGGIGP